MDIDHTTLTEEQIEEFIEFIDWTLVPSHLLTPRIRKFAHMFIGLELRLELEDIFDGLTRTELNEHVFFHSGTKASFMVNTLDKSFSVHRDIWDYVEEKVSRKYKKEDGIAEYLSNILDVFLGTTFIFLRFLELKTGYQAGVVDKIQKEEFDLLEFFFGEKVIWKLIIPL